MTVTASGDKRPPLHDSDFRRTWWRYVMDHAEPWHREHLSHLYDCWERWNVAYFQRSLVPPYLLLATTQTPQRYGDTGLVSGFGGHCQIRIRSSLLAGTHPHMSEPPQGRVRFVEDVLLHEMVHQWQQESTGEQEVSYHGHGPTFRDKANEIGGMLGLGRVRTCKRRSDDAELPSCSQWPHNVRPDGYYLGAYQPRARVPASSDIVPCPHCDGTGRITRQETQP